MPVTVICAVLLLRTGQSTKIKGDAAIAMISVGALAVGYLLMNVFSTGANISGDVCSSLFGWFIDYHIVHVILHVVKVVVFGEFYQIITDLLGISGAVGNGADFFKIVEYLFRFIVF